MGEAKRKKTFRERLLAEQPFCIYCGGVNRAEEVDHVPPRIMFTRKHRPKGLEFSACSECNRAASRFEIVAAVIGRVSPDKDSPEQAEEWGKLLREVDRNWPGLMNELQPSDHQLKQAQKIPNWEGLGALNVSGPIVQNCIPAFGAKLGLALHYHHTRRIVPTSGIVAVKWFSNHDKLTGKFPDSIFSILGEPSTLKQGQFSVSDQFQFASAIADTGRLAAYFSTFNFAFSTIALVAEDAARLVDFHADSKFSPGFLRKT